MKKRSKDQMSIQAYGYRTAKRATVAQWLRDTFHAIMRDKMPKKQKRSQTLRPVNVNARRNFLFKLRFKIA